MRTLPIPLPREELRDFCRRHGIRRLSLFGSILRDDFKPESDIDVLVEFEPHRIPGLIGISGMELELTDLLGQNVDLRTPQDLSRYFRDKVVDSAETIYESG